MSFETFITCDDEDCNSKKEVPQPGQLPQGWVFIQYPQSQVLVGANGRSPQPMGQMISKVFCGGR